MPALLIIQKNWTNQTVINNNKHEYFCSKFYCLFYSTEDVFHIDEVTIYENKFSDNKFALAGETLDAVRVH